MLQNAYFLAKIGADTAENEQHFAEILPIGRRVAGSLAGTRFDAKTSSTASLGDGRPDMPDYEGAREVRYHAFFENAFFENAFFEMHFSKILQIFGGLVLGCIKTKFCKKICVRQHFSNSTRFTYFCTVPISKFSQKIGLKNQHFL